MKLLMEFEVEGVNFTKEQAVSQIKSIRGTQVGSSQNNGSFFEIKKATLK